MNKEEKIKEAWGRISDKINEDGWLYFGYACNGWDDVEEWLESNKLNSDESYYDMVYNQCDNGDLINVKIRPKSLQGIEDNNGWIRIESEDDLPTPELNKEYYFMILEKELNESTVIRGWTDKTGKYFIDNQTYSVIRYEDTFYKLTHYQPIVKPLKPIY